MSRPEVYGVVYTYKGLSDCWMLLQFLDPDPRGYGLEDVPWSMLCLDPGASTRYDVGEVHTWNLGDLDWHVIEEEGVTP